MKNIKGLISLTLLYGISSWIMQECLVREYELKKLYNVPAMAIFWICGGITVILGIFITRKFYKENPHGLGRLRYLSTLTWIPVAWVLILLTVKFMPAASEQYDPAPGGGLLVLIFEGVFLLAILLICFLSVLHDEEYAAEKLPV